ncbi:hypothetical protein B7494_g4228 [Chlorociboria aeruginascens]|nr:hypothetical protein B7494_g4228 [Chlorociboria aeruginascens]
MGVSDAMVLELPSRRSGSIDFKGIICTLSVTSRGKIEDKLDWAFQLYDIDGDGRISYSEMLAIVEAIYKMRQQGILTSPQFGSMVKLPADEDTPEKHVKKIFRIMDKDENGSLDKEEFKGASKRDEIIVSQVMLLRKLFALTCYICSRWIFDGYQGRDTWKTTDGKFQFISISNPDDLKDKNIRRQARSHAVKQALESKRKLQQKSGVNFRVSSSKDYPWRLASKITRTQTLVAMPFSLSAGTLDPFQTLAVDSSRLQALLGDYKARQAVEPVFSITEELAYHSFGAVFQSGLDDPALLNAIMLTFAFTVAEGSIDRECLEYQSQAISHICKRMSSLDRTTSITTIGAILLLAGVEARLGMQFHVQFHMRAIHRLLDICQTEGIYLTGGIKRAIFWQDLNSSVMTGSSRVVNHTTFAELQWRRDPFTPNLFQLPLGFQVLSYVLNQEFIESHVSFQLLRKLQQANDDPIWDDHPELLLWLLYIGGTFTSTEVIRSDDDRVPSLLMKEYYGQRSSVPGTLIITEGTLVSPSACGGFPNAPGIWSNDQVAAWRAITDEVHTKDCFIFCQLFAMGRAGDVEVARRDGISIVAPSALPTDENSPIPRAMTTQEIKQMVQDFAKASENAIRAGFDGAECHGANGYLIDQFTQDTSNKRDDEYGGSVENRSRFVNDILKAMIDAVGPTRIGLRLSPWSTFQGMRMEDPIPQFTDIINKASLLNLAYLHLVESRVSGSEDCRGNDKLDFAYGLWNRPILVAGGYTPADAQKLVDERHPDKDIVVMFGRYFIANPDLVYRIKEGLELNIYDRKTFYISKARAGYADYLFSTKYLESKKR